ncbi:MAG: arginine--tRNA ligase [Nanoarchaeota archaeon]|nr:arginine--tRNA ligase [Nanoarchaeota archaeon]
MFEQEIINLLKKETKLKEIKLEVPPDQSLGDFAFPCFQLSKKYKKNPIEIAKELTSKLKPTKNIKEIKATGPYLNFFINKSKLTEDTIKQILKEKDKYGKGKKKNKTLMLEFFHANTHKGVHIGHIRNVSLGEATSRVLEFDGYNVIRANYQGDIGPHVAKCLWGYLNLKKKEPKDNKGVWLGKIYAEANKKARQNEKIQEEIREINKKLYSKDKITELWKKTRKYCIDDFNNFYKTFGVKFNRLYFESQVEKRGVEIAKELLKKGIAKESEGALIVDLNKYNLGIYVILTSDGHVVYHTKDLALAELKLKEYKIDKSIHVVGKEQEMYFNQLFKTFELTKSKLANKSMHLIYGLVMLPEGKMSSREGNVILYEDLIQNMFKIAEKQIKSRHKKISKKELEKRKQQIAFAALKFSMLNRENNKQIIFDWNKALKFEGETGPYIQYAHARINSILKRSKIKPKADFNLLKTPEEINLIKSLRAFPEIVEEASKHYKASLVANYSLKLAQSFSEFYEKNQVIKAEENLKNARLNLIKAVKQVLKNSLFLLGIEAPEEM